MRILFGKIRENNRILFLKVHLQPQTKNLGKREKFAHTKVINMRACFGYFDGFFSEFYEWPMFLNRPVYTYIHIYLVIKIFHCTFI